MWIQLKSVQYLEIRGKTTKFSPGDWVEVGKQQAQLWLERGDACVPREIPIAMNGAGAGALILSGEEHAEQLLKPFTGLDIQTGTAPDLLWDKTIIWDAGNCAGVLPSRFGTGLGLLDRWEVIVPLWDYSLLAKDLGTPEERELTREVIIDLRVPVYDTRLMFLRRTPDAQRLISLWLAEPGDRKLAFLRALWQVKPFILALPCNWTGHNVPG